MGAADLDDVSRMDGVARSRRTPGHRGADDAEPDGDVPDRPTSGFHSPQALHAMIEAKKLAYADMLRYVGDPAHGAGAGRGHARQGPCRGACEADRPGEGAVPGRSRPARAGHRQQGRDTIYLSVVDRDGNMVSLIQSNSGLRIRHRAVGHRLHAPQPWRAVHAASLARPTRWPRKRPLHTIIPGFMEKDGTRISFGIMGGWNQAQAHAQFVADVADFGFTVQEALEAGSLHQSHVRRLRRGDRTARARSACATRCRPWDTGSTWCRRAPTSSATARRRSPGPTGSISAPPTPGTTARRSPRRPLSFRRHDEPSPRRVPGVCAAGRGRCRPRGARALPDRRRRRAQGRCLAGHARGPWRRAGDPPGDRAAVSGSRRGRRRVRRRRACIGLPWIVDPIDGTKSFIRGVPLFGVLVALEIDGRAEVGVCHMPALSETVAAATGLGCTWNGRTAHVSKVDALGEATVVYSDVRMLSRRLGRGWAAWETEAGLLRSWGDCYGHCLVATGRADVMLDPVMNAWDCAALAADRPGSRRKILGLDRRRAHRRRRRREHERGPSPTGSGDVARSVT